MIDLRGKWSFEIDDDRDFTKPNFDDSNWKRIFVPGTWEGQGFPGYDGYAWYRISFQMPTQYNNKTLVLELGYIELIGTWI